MRRLAVAVMIFGLILPLLLFSFPKTEAADSGSVQNVFAPHEFNVLVVGAGGSYGGYGYLISDLARYGFNVTVLYTGTSDIDYLTNDLSRSLSEYDVVILQGSQYPFPPTKVTVSELSHFTNFGGVLVSIGDALMWDEINNRWFVNATWKDPDFAVWENRFGLRVLSGSDVRSLDHLVKPPSTYLGHWNGTLNRVSAIIPSLPESVPYEVYTTNLYHYKTELSGAIGVYNFTYSTKNWNGITYYENATGATGIFMNIAWTVGSDPSTNNGKHGGIQSIDTRSEILGRILAHALKKDFDTLIKPQPLAAIRLDRVGQVGISETYLNTSLAYFDSVVDANDVAPTIAFTDFLGAPSFTPPIDYWKITAPNVLTQLKSKYRDWEFSSSLRYYTEPRNMTKEQIQALIDSIKGNYTRLGMDLFSTIVAPVGRWNQSTLDAMFSNNLYLIDIFDNSYSDWWNLRVNSSIVVHSGMRMFLDYRAENFTQPGYDKNSIYSNYFSSRHTVALAVVHGFPSFVYNVQNFRRNEVGTYSLETICKNLTYEIPDIRFVPLSEAALYFGNKWMHIENASRTSSEIEFDMDTSAIPSVVSIGKGMLWLRINTNKTINEVWVDGQPWYYFDDYSIRVPADSSHVRIVMGTPTNPRVIRASNKVTSTSWGLARFTVYMSAQQGLNVSLRLLIPEYPFSGIPPSNWTVYSTEVEWGYKFDATLRLLDFWAVSDDGLLTFKVGFDVVPPYVWSVNHTRTDYDLNVTVTVNATELQTSIKSVVLSYMYNNSEWIEDNMSLQNGLYVAQIPAFSWGTSVKYNVNASDTTGNWAITKIISYNVTDTKPPELEIPNWTPQEPSVGELVTVTIGITEPSGASGIKKVNLWYRADRSKWEQALPMILQEGAWTASFPALDTEKVDFMVEAEDNAGNRGLTEIYSYNVRRSVINLQRLLLLIGAVAVIAVSISTVTIFVKRRRRLNKTAGVALWKNDVAGLMAKSFLDTAFFKIG